MSIRKTLLNLYEAKSAKKSSQFGMDERAKTLKKRSIISIVLIIVLIILVNIFVDVLLQDRLLIDLSSEKMNTLSQESMHVLENLEKDIEIIALFEEPQTLETIDIIYRYFLPILNEYVDNSNGKISLRFVDPNIDLFIKNEIDSTGFTDFSEGHFVIRSDETFFVINPYDCFVYDGYYLEQNTLVPLYNNVETIFTGYIHQLNDFELSHLYYLKGHGQPQSDSLTTLLLASGFRVEDLYLPVVDAIPDDCDILFINLPQNDISSEEKDIILSYLRQGGSVVIAYKFIHFDTPYDNINALLQEMNMFFDDYIVVEQNPQYLLDINIKTVFRGFVQPDYRFLSNSDSLLIGQSRALFELDSPDQNIVINTIISSSPSAELLQRGEVVSDRLASTSKNIVMHAVNKNYAEPGQMLVISSDTFTSDDYLRYSGINDVNAIFFRRTLEYMLEKEAPDLVETKAFPNYSLMSVISVSQQTFWTLTLMAFIPLVFVIAAVVTYARRKNK